MPRKQQNSPLLPIRVMPVRQVKRKAEVDLLNKKESKRSKKATPTGKAIIGNQLEEIILKRKIELKRNVQQEKQRHLISIEERKNGNAMFPLELFPEEIWMLILSLLDDPKDLASMWEVHSLFRNLLETKQNQEILLPEVMTIVPVLRSLWYNHSHSSNYEKRICKTCGFPVELAQIPLLRKVSKCLRNAVDRWHEDNILRVIKEEYTSFVIEQVPSFSINLFHEDDDNKDEKKLDGMINNFCNGPKEARAKRFLLRSFKLSFGDETGGEGFDWEYDTLERYDAFKNKVKTLLQVIGDQIWRFSFSFYDVFMFEENGVMLQDIYPYLLELVSLMPNLKWLKIEFGYCVDADKSKDILNDLFFRSHPFPRLKHLERVSFVFGGDDGVQRFEMLASLLQVNPHIKALDLEPLGEHRNIHVFFGLLFRRMRLLQIKLEMLHASSCVPLVDTLQPLSRMKWNLRSLKFDINDSPSLEFIGDAFQFVNNFPTLEKLSISMTRIKIGGFITQLKLPNLHTFNLELYMEDNIFTAPSNITFFYSLQFLLHSKKLSTLIWSCSNENTGRDIRNFFSNALPLEKEIIDFRGGHSDLKCSNIWKFFPELEYVEVHTSGAGVRSPEPLNAGGRPDESWYTQKQYRRSNVIKFYKEQLADSVWVSETGQRLTKKQVIM